MIVRSFYPPVQTFMVHCLPQRCDKRIKSAAQQQTQHYHHRAPVTSCCTRGKLIGCFLFPHQALFKSLLHPVNSIHQPEHITVLQQRRRSFPSRGLLAGLSHVTSLLLYGSNRPQGLLGLAGLMLDKSNSTLLLCGKLESEPESDCALPATGGRKYDGVCGRSSPSASLSASWGLWPWWWWCLCSWWWCPPWWWGSCIMFSTSESSDWLEC